MSLDHNSKCGECGRDPCMCHAFADPEQDSDPEEIADEAAPFDLKRSRVGVKEPMSQMVEDVDDGDEEIIETSRKYQKVFKEKLRTDERYKPEPDLDAFFDEFGLSAESRIAMCRTYANYLTQKLRSSGRIGPPRARPTNKKLFK